MQLNFIQKFLGSGFYTGYIPFASGTFASLAALLIYYIPGFEDPVIIIPAIILFLLYGIDVGTVFEKDYGKDPTECTIDEIVGMWISLLFLPKIWYISLTAFFVWRLMDIIKPYPARKLESLKGGMGIMIDDVIAAIYSLIFMHLLYQIYNFYSIN